MEQTTFGKLVHGAHFHFDLGIRSGLLSDMGKPDTSETYVRVSARKYARVGLTRTNTVGSTKVRVWATGKHHSI